MPEYLNDEELADWRAGRNAIYQLAALMIGARLAVADGYIQFRATRDGAITAFRFRYGAPGRAPAARRCCRSAAMDQTAAHQARRRGAGRA
jgi:hypothetical protein